MLKLALALTVVAAGVLYLFGTWEEERGGGGPSRTAPGQRREARPRPALERARCPKGVPGCRSVTGRIVYVEAVDPDGDGDLHVVVVGGGITLPGMTSIDVAPELRPRRDPRVGQRATGAGPVQTGSYGQSQIHALRFAVQR